MTTHNPAQIAHEKRRYIQVFVWLTILTCLEDGVSTIPRIVAKIYGELDADLKAAAALSVLAHLEHMISRGLARVCQRDRGAQAEAGTADLSGVYSVSAAASAPAS